MTQFYRKDRKCWRYEFEYKGESYSKSGFDSKRKARDAEVDERRRITASQPRGEGPLTLTLKDYIELWMADHVKVHCRPRTAREYRQSLDSHVIPQLGTRGLTQITRADLRAHFAQLSASNLARNTIRNILIPLRACLNAAVDDGLIDQNPATGQGRRVRAKTEKDAARVHVFKKHELDTILNTATSDFGDFLALLAGSGLRLGEGLGLQPKDIGPDYLDVRRNVQWMDGEYHVFAPKSGQERRVEITVALATRLRARPGPWLFEGEAPWRPERPRKAWYALIEGLTVPKLRLHDLRHTYAALLLGKGAPPSYVKEQLGHSSIQVTVDVYGHLIPGTNRKWVDNVFGEETL